MPADAELAWLKRHCGPVVDREALTVRKARELADFLTGRDDVGAACVEARERDRIAWIVVEVEVDVGQLPVVDIWRRERLAIGFSEADLEWPEARVLRESFPRNISHMMLLPRGEPVWLCLSEEPWDEYRRRWSPSLLVRLIRHWLTETARGQLHASNQDLEPFVVGSANRAILPFDAGDVESAYDATLYGYLTDDHLPGFSFAVRFYTKPQNGSNDIGYVLAALDLPPQQHGLMRSAPRTVADLKRLLTVDGFDFEGRFIEVTKAWLSNRQLLSAKPTLLVRIPMVRETGSETERNDLRLFILHTSIRELGISLGIWHREGGTEGFVLGARDVNADARDVGVDLLNPAFEITSEIAAHYNGYASPSGSKILAIGAGALGSQILDNLTRFGETIIGVADADLLLPHNQARHGIFSHGPVGVGKARLAALQISRMIVGAETTAAFRVNALRPAGKDGPSYTAALADCSAILDMAASVAVSRHLALDVAGNARRISAFLSPSGHDLVVFVEDSAREARLDHLEMSYYAAVASNERMDGHLATVGHVRYAQSCREVSSQISQAFVGAHAGIASHVVRQALEAPEALAAVWRMNPDTMEVTRIDLDVRPMRSFQLGEWTVLVGAGLLDWVTAQRDARLPNETGGVLLGDFDSSRKTIYLASALPTPPDSTEEAGGFVRGAQGLASDVEAVRTRTQKMLVYVGEWHSHPRGHGVRPSGDDVGLYLYMAEHMTVEGFPPVMMIAGDNEFSLIVDGNRTPLDRPKGT